MNPKTSGNPGGFLFCTMIEATGISYSYDGKAVLSFPDIHVPKGGQCLLLGQSGSGKTTLLHLLGGLIRPKGGSLRIANTDLSSMGGAAVDRFRGRNIGFVFQQHHLIDSLTVRQNLELPAYCAATAVEPARLKELLGRLGLEGKADAPVGSLSQGQQQRVAIGRALMNRPSVLLADEPTSALDDHHCGQVTGLLTELVTGSGATLLIATHDSRLKDLIPDRVIL